MVNEESVRLRIIRPNVPQEVLSDEVSSMGKSSPNVVKWGTGTLVAIKSVIKGKQIILI